jgi:rsbT co-antagonist protein RsbR
MTTDQNNTDWHSDLQQQVALFRQLFDAIPTPIFYKDAQGIYLGCNYAFEAATGQQRDEIVGKTVYDISPGDLAERYHQADLDLIEQQGTQVYEGEIQFADGSRHNVIFHKAVFHRPDGTPGGMVGTILDITQRKQAEQVLEAQARALHELAAPLLRISDTTLLMPIVGAIDSNRARQIMETLLEGIAEQQAETAILDITGVSIIDTQVADALIRTAQAVRLLGANVILTGIGAPMAQTLVQLGVDLSDLATHGTLQSGIAYALQHEARQHRPAHT